MPVAQTYGLTEACSQVTTTPPRRAGDRWRCTAASARACAAPRRRDPRRAARPSRPAARRDGCCTPATSARSTSTGACASPAARPTRSSPAARTSRPAEVEAVLAAHPAVAEAGGPRPARREWGEAVVATVVLRDGAPRRRPRSCAPTCAARLARYKVPKDVGFADRAAAHAVGQAAAAGAGMSFDAARPSRARAATRWERAAAGWGAPRAAARPRASRSRSGSSTRSTRSPASACSSSRRARATTGLLAAELHRARAAADHHRRRRGDARASRASARRRARADERRVPGRWTPSGSTSDGERRRGALPLGLHAARRPRRRAARDAPRAQARRARRARGLGRDRAQPVVVARPTHELGRAASAERPPPGDAGAVRLGASPGGSQRALEEAGFVRAALEPSTSASATRASTTGGTRARRCRRACARRSPSSTRRCATTSATRSTHALPSSSPATARSRCPRAQTWLPPRRDGRRLGLRLRLRRLGDATATS